MVSGWLRRAWRQASRWSATSRKNASVGPTELDQVMNLSPTAQRGVLPRIMKMAVRTDPVRVGLAMACALGAAAAGLVVPKLFGKSVDQVVGLLNDAELARKSHASLADQRLLESQSLNALLMTALLIIAATSVQGLMTAFGDYEGERVGQRVASRIRLLYFKHLQRLSFAFHDCIHSADLITRGMIDVEGIRVFVQIGMMQTMTLVLVLGVALFFMFSADRFMALLALSFVPLSMASLARSGYLMRTAWFRIQSMMSVLTRTMEENLHGVRVVRAFAASAFELAKFDVAAKQALAQSYRRIVLAMRATRVTTLTFYASMALVLWLGGRRVVEGQMTPGRLTEFIFYMQILLVPVRSIIMIVVSSSRAVICGARVFEILDRPLEIAEVPDAIALGPEVGSLSFENVSFGYTEGMPILRDVSFSVAPGKTLGIVGAPGSGKSTIANLIPRFYEPTEGRILLGCRDIRDITLNSLREHVSVIQQESFLFDSSIMDNVAYADPWVEIDRVENATQTAQLSDFVETLPSKYDTRVGERGVALSGGQRQRMSIARGILPGPGVVVFDDATAAIDAITEQRVRDALASETRGKATIIIAHRLSSLMHADEIIVLDQGMIVERGSHADLLSLRGEYFDLYQLQTLTEQGVSIADRSIARKTASVAQ